MSSNGELAHGRASSFTPQRRGSPQPRQMQQQSRQNEGRRSEGSRSSRKGRQHQPLPRAQDDISPRSQAVVLALNEQEKAELAQAVLASFSVKRRDEYLERFEPSLQHPRREVRRGDPRNDNGRSRKGRGRQSRVESKQTELGMNRFRFILAPASCYCESPMQDLLAMQTTDLWPHVVAVIANDVDPLCSICLDYIQAGRALACGHIFCAVCIARCLEAADADPMLQKCPVCTEGELSKAQLRRCSVRRQEVQPSSYSFVRSINLDEPPPVFSTESVVTSRIVVASGEGMMQLIDNERKEVVVCKKDLARFRDEQGLRLSKDIETELDKAHVEWQRHIGRSKVRSFGAPSKGDWTYQRSDGSLEFLHPLNLKALLKNCDGDESLLPTMVRANKTLESEDWADKKFKSMVKLGIGQIPESPLSIKITEVELEGLSSEALQAVEKEASDRAKKRQDREERRVKQQIKVMEAEATIEETRRRAREEEEALLKAYFGYEERKAELEAKGEQERPVMALNSFSAVVSSMGHFPQLKKSPSLGPTKSADKVQHSSPTLEPLRSAWGVTGPQATNSSFSLGSPTQDTSFAQAASQGVSKKVLWQNNPGRRGN